MEIMMRRCIPRGYENPNTGKVYTNLDEKVKEAIDRFDGKLPLTLSNTSTRLMDKVTVNPEDVIGYITDIDAEQVHVELNEYGTELLQQNRLFGRGVQFNFLAHTDSDTVDRITTATTAQLITFKITYDET
ncbi:hypothetical protein [uncultured Duncaniella sp.]|uniref:hypothetical protein n=2 Tax=uncultured Duncaniella sp. TaxID=2768039 RepID=UPI0026261CA9|nr:hypothetical protein [uncultured Duncaniella sp.]